MLKWIAALAGAGLLVSLAACGGAAPPAPPSALGAGITSGDAVVTVTKVSTRTKVGIQYATERASDGAVLVVVAYTTKNAGTKPIQGLTLPSIKLRDPAGTIYSPDLAKSSAYMMESGDINEKLFSDLNPGVTTQGVEVFEVAADQFNAATWVATISGAGTAKLQ